MSHGSAAVPEGVAMSIIRRGKSPILWVEFWYEGKRYRQSSGTTNRRQAVAFEQKLRQQLHDEIKLGRIAYEPMRFDEAVKRYKTTHLNLKVRLERTAKGDENTLKHLTEMVGPATLLHEISTPVVARLKETLVSGNRKPATVNKYLATLRAILRMANLEWGTLPVLPRFKLYRLDNERSRWLREDEEAKLLDACKQTPHLHDLVVFLLDTGARLTEATSLTWANVDLPEDGPGYARLMFTKSRKPRGLPLPRRTDQMLRRLKGQRPDGQDHVFLFRTTGCHWRGTKPQAKPFGNPHGSWDAAVKRAGLGDLHLHDLRHTYASRLVQLGVPVLTVSKLLGHATIRMTMRYSHLANEDLRLAVSRLDRSDD